LDWQICGTGSVITRLKTYAYDFLVHLDFNHKAANEAALPGISKLVTHIVTLLFDITLTNLIEKFDCQISSVQCI